MLRTSTAKVIVVLARPWQKLCECLWMHIRLERRAHGMRIVLEPARAPRAARASSVKRELLPPMPIDQMFAAHCDLSALLDRAPGARRVWPSLALLERVLGSGAAESIHRVEACVLRHAARCLDQLGDESFSPGLVVLRRRIEFVLRRKHGDRPTHQARVPGPSIAERGADFEDSLTDFIEIERLQFTRERLVLWVEPEQPAASRRA
jgi:hypothetical protein